MSNESSSRASPGTFRLWLARVHISYVAHDFTPPETCPKCQASLGGNDGVGIREAYFEQRQVLGDFLPAEEHFPGGFEGNGRSDIRDDLADPTHAHGYACGECGHLLVGEAVTIRAPDAPRISNPKDVGELMSCLSDAEPEARVVLGSSSGQHRLLSEVEASRVRVTERRGTVGHVAVDARDVAGVDAEAALVFWPEDER